MTSCLVLTLSASDAPALSADLESAGIHIIGAVQRNMLVQEAVRLAPDVVVVRDPSPDAALFDAAALLLATAPRPVLLFTSDPDVDKMTRALECGIHAYVVNGYAPQRLRPLIHLAQARFAHEQRLREELADVSGRFEERKLVDRAKGILMRARQVSEDEAFRVLRAASMHSNLRVGQVSRQVIAAAGFAEAINRAGQMRMLSQRLVKLHALAAMSVASATIDESCARVEANLAALGKSLSKATYGDLIEEATAPWSSLKPLLERRADAALLEEADALAERMLQNADRLVSTLETTGAAASLHVINVAARQRMLSQRVAKASLLAALLKGPAAERAAAQAREAGQAFEAALAFLDTAPLTSREIRESLDQAGELWKAMNDARKRIGGSAGPQALAQTSEALLALFEQLTERYERSMQVLIG
jgi:AmiR/NasT family two-component response regulator